MVLKTFTIRDSKGEFYSPPFFQKTHGARWYNFYAGMYNYYHVISCQYHVFIENLGGEDIWAYVMFMNDEQPPTGATNQDIQLWSGVR